MDQNLSAYGTVLQRKVNCVLVLPVRPDCTATKSKLCSSTASIYILY